MKRLDNTTHCFVRGLCPELVTSLIRGLTLTTLFICAIAIVLGAALLIIDQ